MSSGAMDRTIYGHIKVLTPVDSWPGAGFATCAARSKITILPLTALWGFELGYKACFEVSGSKPVTRVETSYKGVTRVNRPDP